MAEQSKFAGALGRLKRPLAPEAPEHIPETDEERASDPAPDLNRPAVKGRRVGKRSDPEFTPTTFFVRKQTKRRVTRLLLEADASTDLSDLVEELLAKWVSEHSQV